MEEHTEKNADLETVAWKRFPFAVYIERGVSVIETGLNYVGVSLIIFLMFFATGGVFGRYLFNKPFTGYWDMAEMMLAVLIFFGIAYTQRMGGHIRVEIFLTHAIRGRGYHITEFFTLLLSLLVFAFIAFYGLKRALYAYTSGDVTMSMMWPAWPPMLSVAIGSFLLCARFIIEMFQHLLQAVVGAGSKDLG